MKTKRYYYILITLMIIWGISFILSCDKEKDTQLPPTNRLTLETDSVKSVLYHTAIAYSSIGELKNITVQQYGHCWDTIETPTIESDKTQFNNLASQSTFNSNLTDLKPAKKYYVRSYAKTASLTAYSEISSFTTKSLEPPTLSSDSIRDITSTTVKIWGAIKLDGGTIISARGVCWGTAINPTLTNQHFESNSLTNVFATPITGLTRNTIYHVRVYATNQSGTAYGNDLTFTTNAELPQITTTAITGITANTAIGGGNITSDGSSAITARGICWSLTESPTLSNLHTTDGNGSGIFTSNITGLQPGKIYYVRAYATNNVGTVYGNQENFTTPAVLPTVTATNITNITATAATGGGNITDDGGAPITARGVCWSISQNPTINDSKTADGTGTGIYASTINDLTTLTIYYIRAYATNGAGTSYSAQVSFTTIGLPTITTAAIIGITAGHATAGGDVTFDGGTTSTERGVCWSTHTNPLITDNNTINGIGTGVFSTEISGLTLGTTYYVRAYAKNIVGTVYGNEVSFTSSSTLSIGDAYQGGIVAYLLKSGDLGYVAGQVHGLIAAPSDQSISTPWDILSPSIVIGTTASAIGTGNANTNTIVAILGTGNYAARLCQDLVLGGYNDWYLPSIYELQELYNNRILIGGFNYTKYYWTSTEYSQAYSWKLLFNTGYSDYGGYKSELNCVRAIRSF